MHLPADVPRTEEGVPVRSRCDAAGRRFVYFRGISFHEVSIRDACRSSPLLPPGEESQELGHRIVVGADREGGYTAPAALTLPEEVV